MSRQPPHSARAVRTTRNSDPAQDDALPLDEAGEEAVPPTVPPLETAIDDDEGGADPVDPETGTLYDEKDPGTAAPLADREGGPRE